MVSGSRKRHDLSISQLEDIVARLREFEFQGKRIRVLYEDGDAWLVLADVLQALDYRVKASHIAKMMRPEELTLKDIAAKNTLVNCINRSGLYAITLFANKPEAQALYEWSKENIYRNQGRNLFSEVEVTAEIIRLVYQLTAEEKAEMIVRLRQAVAKRL